MGNILASKNITENTDDRSTIFYQPHDIIFRKTIHDILVNNTSIVKGEKIYTNQLKAWCKITGDKGGPPYTSLGPQTTFSGTNMVDVALPSVIDTMSLSTSSTNEIKTSINKSRIVLNITTDNDQDTSNILDSTISKFRDSSFK